MKAFKLILTFVVLLALIVGAFLLSAGGDVFSFGSKTKKVPLAQYEKMIDEHWKGVEGWNERVFKSNADLIYQLSKKYDTQSLKDYNTNEAIRRIKVNIIGDWATPTCDSASIKEFINGIDTIIAVDRNAASNHDVKLIRTINNTYLKALNTAHKGIGLAPGFDGKSWGSFASYRKNVMRERDNILNDTNYTTYLINISDIKNGLGAIPSKLNLAKSKFYTTLSSQIAAYFGGIPSAERKREQLDTLRLLRNRFNEESGSTSTDLQTFVEKFADDVIHNEELR